MSTQLSRNTQAILLLTAPLITGRGQASPDALTPGEYKRLARRLRELQRQPADLLAPDAPELLKECLPGTDPARVNRLIARGFQLSQAVEYWQARAIWVVSRADPDYPARLKSRLKEDAPPILYGCGDRRVLESGGLAVVGSRDVDEALIQYAERIGQLAAEARRTVISGGARGIDQAAMRGALEAGGAVAGVLGDSLERAAIDRDHRAMLMDGRLALISPYDPRAGFHVGNAMQRNKVVYALADAALVVNSDFEKGGTWAGAVEQLDKLKLVRVYVRSTGAPNTGIDALRKRGALPWPNPEDPDALTAILSVDFSTTPKDAVQIMLESPAAPRVVRDTDPPDTPRCDTPARQSNGAKVKPADQLLAKVSELLMELLDMPRNDADIASALGVARNQARQWLDTLVDQGMIEKHANPVRYARRSASLFGDATPGPVQSGDD